MFLVIDSLTATAGGGATASTGASVLHSDVHDHVSDAARRARISTRVPPSSTTAGTVTLRLSPKDVATAGVGQHAVDEQPGDDHPLPRGLPPCGRPQHAGRRRALRLGRARRPAQFRPRARRRSASSWSATSPSRKRRSGNWSRAPPSSPRLPTSPSTDAIRSATTSASPDRFRSISAILEISKPCGARRSPA